MMSVLKKVFVITAASLMIGSAYAVGGDFPLDSAPNRLNNNALPIFDAKNTLTEPQIQQLVGFYTGIGCKK